MLAMQPTDEQADIMLTNRFAADEVRLGAALVQSVAGALAAPHHGADAGRLGQGRQAVPERLRARWGERHPGSRVEIVPECGHVPAVEKPEITAKEIIRLYAGTR